MNNIIYISQLPEHPRTRNQTKTMFRKLTYKEVISFLFGSSFFCLSPGCTVSNGGIPCFESYFASSKTIQHNFPMKYHVLPIHELNGLYVYKSYKFNMYIYITPVTCGRYNSDASSFSRFKLSQSKFLNKKHGWRISQAHQKDSAWESWWWILERLS